MDRLTKHFETGLTHLNTLKAAADTTISTLDLIASAKEILIQELASQEHQSNLPLVTLHYRAGEELLHQATALMTSKDALDRELGCWIVREFPSIDDAPTTYSPQIISAIQKMIDNGENNADVLIAGLAAVGWQCHPDAQALFSRFIGDHRPEIRQVIANNLLGMVKSEDSLITFVIAGFNQLGRDSDPDIRWSIFYDIAEHYELFQKDKTSFYQLILEGKEDADSRIQALAVTAFEKLFNNVGE